MLFLGLTRYRNNSKKENIFFKELCFSLIVWQYIPIAVLFDTVPSDQKAKCF